MGRSNVNSQWNNNTNIDNITTTLHSNDSNDDDNDNNSIYVYETLELPVNFSDGLENNNNTQSNLQDEIALHCISCRGFYAYRAFTSSSIVAVTSLCLAAFFNNILSINMLRSNLNDSDGIEKIKTTFFLPTTKV
ncbi:hypothetical protein EDD21DRAFT_407812 [Dissophora ornata]|nr:hypothetical protein BGZ58_011152 [Dissophora ornata]KAI8597163.1 hypothetical protein EDD21DRAFT_407812 [Dissophora ornata]